MDNRKKSVASVISPLLAVCAAVVLATMMAIGPETERAAAVEAGSGVLAGGNVSAAESAPETDVLTAANAANDYAKARGFQRQAFKDLLERELEGARCYSLPQGYYIAYGGMSLLYKKGTVSKLDDMPVPVYDSFESAREAIGAMENGERPAAFMTCGLNELGDKGHGYYEKNGEGGYQLASAEGAVNVYQLGYVSGGSVNPAIVAFQESDFHTLVFPQGDYLLTDSIYQYCDNRSFYGLDARLYMDNTFANTYGDKTRSAVLCVQGNIVWGERQDDGVRRDAYYTTSHQEYNGLTIDKPAGVVKNGYNYLAFVRNANDISFTHCTFTAEAYDIMCVDLYGNYDGVTFDDVTCKGDGDLEIRDLCNNVERLEGDTWVQKGTIGGGRNVTVRNCSFTMNSIDEGVPIFAGNEEGLGRVGSDGVWREYDILNNCLVENVVLENNTWNMEQPPDEKVKAAGKTRIVAFTCGYQDSPVRNITVRNNTFDAFANYCFMQFGYADGVEFSGNTVIMRGNEGNGITNDRWGDIFERDRAHERTGPTTNVYVHDNTFELKGERSLVRPVDMQLDEAALTFIGNEIDIEGRAERLVDSTATCAGNTFKANYVKSIYSHAKDVHDNTYEIALLSSIYEADGLSADADARFTGERADIAGMTDKAMLMVFNNEPTYNGHDIVFDGCYYNIRGELYQYRRIAYDTSGVQDGTTVRFTGCIVNGFWEHPYDTIDRNNPEKVKLVIEEPAVGPFTLKSVEQVVEGGGFENLDGKVVFATRGTGDVGQVSGKVVGGFSLLGNARLDDAEVTSAVNRSVADDGDVLEFYRYTGSGWEIATYAEVVDGTVSFETTGFGAGRFTVVNLTRGDVEPAVFDAGTGGNHKDALRKALGTPGVYKASAPLDIPECTINASHGVTVAQLRDTTITGSGTGDQNNITIKGDDTTSDIHLLFEGCTFDAEPLILHRPGTYVFDRCTFVNSPRVSITAAGEGVRVFVFNSTMRDNKPPVEEFNTNENSVRSWRYAALSYQASNVTMHVCRTSITGYQTNPTVLVTANREGSALYYDHNTMENCGGCGISMNSSVRGRIADNTFRNIGAQRGAGDYEGAGDPRWGVPSGIGQGKGVGGNAVYGHRPCYNMRVSGNDIAYVMENGIEGHYWCVDDNVINTTGCRFDEGFDTVSTEAIWGSSIYVRGNKITHPHGSGIIAQTSHGDFDIPFDIEVSGNTVEKDGYGLMDDKNALRVSVGSGFASREGARIVVKDNVVSGYRSPTLVIGDRTEDPVAVFEDNEITDLPLKVERAEMQQGDDDFIDVTEGLQLVREDLSNRNNVSGQTVAQFALESSREALGYTEVTLSFDDGLARDGEIVELYRTNPRQWAWKPYGYYQVRDGAFTFELGSQDDLGKFAIVNKTPAFEKVPTDIASMPGSSGDARLMAAIKQGGYYTAGEGSPRITVPRHYLNQDGQYASALDMRNLDLYCSDTTDNNGFAFYNAESNDFYFENCTFDHLGFRFFKSGHYAFVNCTFKGYPRNAAAILPQNADTQDAHLYLYGCTFEDNVPNKSAWNENKSGDRHNNYAAARVNGAHTSLHAAGCTFKNLQTDSTVIVQSKSDSSSFDDVTVCFERNEMTDCGGAGLVMDNAVRGRVDGNAFKNIGATRGMNGYQSTIHPTLGEEIEGVKYPGAGVGGNAVFGRMHNVQMRVRGNICENLMENGIEGTYYCISGNTVDTTGYRYDDASGDCYNGGYKTVSTEGIAAAGTWYVTDNTVKNVHGRGLSVSVWGNRKVVVKDNVISRREGGNPLYDTSEGIKIRTDENSYENVRVENNAMSGFENNYRVLHAGGARTCKNFAIIDPNDGKIMGPVYSNLRGVKLVTKRDVPLICENSEKQRFELPEGTCIVCLELTVKSSASTVNVHVSSQDSKLNTTLPLTGFTSGEFVTTYAAFKAAGFAEVTLSAEDGSELEIGSVSGTYEVEPATQAVYSISYDLGGGAVQGTNPSTYTPENGFDLVPPERMGYTFSGWTGSGLAHPVKALSVAANSMMGDLSYVANWEVDVYPIAYELNGGTEAKANRTSYTIETATFKLTNPTKKGYTFAGWTGTGLGGSTAQVSVPVGSTGNRTYKANWKKNTYSISYNLNKGSVSKANRKSYAVDTATFKLTNPTRKGYTFAGWKGTGLSKATMTVSVSKGSVGNRTYTATWKAKPDMLGKTPVSAKVSGGKATIVRLLAAVSGAVTVNKMTDNPSAKSVPVSALGKKAFSGAKMTSLTLGANVKTVGANAFLNAKKLKSVKIGKNVRTVGNAAFKGCVKLKTLSIATPKLLKSSCKVMLNGSKVTTVKLVGMTKSQKVKALKNYRKWFPKKVAGRKLVIK